MTTTSSQVMTGRDSPIDSLIASFTKRSETAGLPSKFTTIVVQFIKEYAQHVKRSDVPTDTGVVVLSTYLDEILKYVQKPYDFEPYHTAVRSPVDTFKLGIDLIRPLVDRKKSTVGSFTVLQRIEQQLKAKENVILLANHQSEADPQAIGLLLEKDFPHLAEKITYVAGDRVTTDPMAVPMSVGCNLFCIYSKRYIDHPPEQKGAKQRHNARAIKQMKARLDAGSTIIYVAPSGGRDRKNEDGIVEIAPFDPESCELFMLLGKKSKKPTHYYLLTLDTYNMLPPPDSIQKELGEVRKMEWGPIHALFSEEIDVDDFPGSAIKNPPDRREKRSAYFTNRIREYYHKLT